MKNFALAAVLAFFILSATAQHKQIREKAIICLTYDDALTTHLTTAIPQLDSAGLKATFFLTAIQGSSQSDIIGQTPEAVLGWFKAAKTMDAIFIK